MSKRVFCRAGSTKLLGELPSSFVMNVYTKTKTKLSPGQCEGPDLQATQNDLTMFVKHSKGVVCLHLKQRTNTMDSKKSSTKSNKKEYPVTIQINGEPVAFRGAGRSMDACEGCRCFRG